MINDNNIIGMINDDVKLIKYQMQNVYKYDYICNCVLTDTIN